MDIERIGKERFSDKEFYDMYVDFLHKHLGRYTDKRDDIAKALDHSLDENGGGDAYLATEDGKVLGALLTNRTGMSGYIPENIIVYVAVREGQRGKGIGKGLMKKAMDDAEGDICLHVEHDNPAKRLYERLGFKSKYLEMRYVKE
ncbi:MAG TPA: GNAT family N-acetyltransferase [Candidatus Methanofastidiosa archaeon]|nr:GNAT family N-acetyltransferase [Candidatus Methanofastidiosa archaeon]